MFCDQPSPFMLKIRDTYAQMDYLDLGSELFKKRLDFCHILAKIQPMKRYLLPILFTLPMISTAQFEMKFSYLFNSPQNFMRSSLDQSHGFAMDYYGSVKKTNYYTGISFNMGIYGYHTEPIDFTATDGSIVKTNLNITNSYNSWSIYHKYRFSRFEENGGRLIPFIDARTGWAFFRTSLYIEDPEDVSNCEPLEQDIMQKDNTWNVYGGAGFDFLLSGLRNKENPSPCQGLQSYFTVSFGYNYGGKVSYMNVDRDGSNTTSQHNHGTSPESGDQSAYYTTWVNTQSQVTHQHHTGYLYNSPVRMLEIKAGFVLRF